MKRDLAYDGDDAPTLPMRRRAHREPGGDLPALLRVEELADLLRVDRKTVYEGISSGAIPGARRIGRAIRVSRDAVIDWLRQGGVSRRRR